MDGRSRSLEERVRRRLPSGGPNDKSWERLSDGEVGLSIEEGKKNMAGVACQ